VPLVNTKKEKKPVDFDSGNRVWHREWKAPDGDSKENNPEGVWREGAVPEAPDPPEKKKRPSRRENGVRKGRGRPTKISRLTLEKGRPKWGKNRRNQVSTLLLKRDPPKSWGIKKLQKKTT